MCSFDIGDDTLNGRTIEVSENSQASTSWFCTLLLGVGLLVVACCVVLGTAAGSASAQTASTLTVVPSTDLVDEQQVQVSASVPIEYQVYVVRQCLASATTADDCDPSMLGFIETGHGNGAPRSVSAAVYREIDLADGVRDCAVDACVLSVMPYFGDQLVESVAISFDPATAPNPRPTATAMPADDLIDGELITVEGAGFKPFERIWINQCGPNLGNECRHGIADAAELDGTFRAEVMVSRVLTVHGVGQFDCAKTNCVLFVQGSGRPASAVAISFDPEALVESGPTVKVRPRKNLADGDVVSLTITAQEGERLMSYAYVTQCGLTADGLVDGATCRYVGSLQDYSGGGDGDGGGDQPTTTLPPQGDPPATTGPPPTPTTIGPLGTVGNQSEAGPVSLAGNVQVRRSIFIEDHDGSRRTDCIETKCVLAVQSEEGITALSQILKFDPELVVAKPVVKIKSRNGLQAGTQVSITVKNSRAQYVQVGQCPRSAMTHLDHRCQRIGDAQRSRTDPPIIGLEGFTVRVTPVRYVGTASEQVDCREPKSCDFRVFGTDGPMRRLLVNFESEGSPLTEKFRLAQRNDLKNREPVAIKVGRVGQGWNLQQCPDRSSNYGCLRLQVQNQVQANGVTRGTVAPRRIVNGVDCATTRCQLRLFIGHRETSRVLLRFDPDVPGDPQPVFEAKPRRGLVDGQTVVVTGENTGGRFQAQQCVRDEEGNTGDCFYLQQRNVSNPDEDPNTRQSAVAVRRNLGDVDCAEAAGRCRLVLLRRNSHQVIGMVNLRFDAEVEVPPPAKPRVHPRKGLADGQLVTVSLAGANHLDVRQCVRLDGEVLQGSCVYVALGGGTRDEGSLTVTVRVRRNIGPEEVETPFDCASTPRSCVLLITDYSNHGEPNQSEVSLVFDRNADPVEPGTGTLTITTEGPISANSVVTVTGKGFVPGLAMFILPCDDGAETPESCDTGTLTPVTSDGTGGFTVEAFFSDCGTERCTIGVGDAAGIEFSQTEPFEVLR